MGWDATNTEGENKKTEREGKKRKTGASQIADVGSKSNVGDEEEKLKGQTERKEREKEEEKEENKEEKKTKGGKENPKKKEQKISKKRTCRK